MAQSGSDQRRAGWKWRKEAPPRPILSDSSIVEELETEIDWIQDTLVKASMPIA